MSQLRNSNVPGGLQSSDHPGQFARKALPEADSLKTTEPSVVQSLKMKGAGIKSLVESGNSLRIKASSAYARNLAQTIGSKYPNVDRIYFKDSHDEVDGRTYSLSYVSMLSEGVDVPEELRYPALGNLDDFELNGTELDDSMDFEEGDTDYNKPFLNVADYMDMGNEDDSLVASYARELEALQDQARSQAAAAHLCIAARKIRARFPEISTITLGNDPDSEGFRDSFQIGSATLANGEILDREGVEGERIHWGDLDAATPTSDLGDLAGRDLSVDELIGWHPGDSIS